ncbi:release factor glutamine methyltransferase [Clostridia bacterium]|nr:release factor glutamine methyltransferase [Clostridia bacterium]
MKTPSKIESALRANGIENARFEANEMVQFCNRSGADITALLLRRISGEPLQYILGEWDFYGDTYKLNRSCLIPRPETEFLAEYVINHAPSGSVLIDLCTGSGCIAISTLKRRSDLKAVAADISEGAVSIADENAIHHRVADRIKIIRADVLTEAEAIGKLAESLGEVGMIVSNPPYLTSEETATRKRELIHEPKEAFDGGVDGLTFYRGIIAEYTAIFPRAVCVFEAGAGQSEAVSRMLEDKGRSVSIIKDYAGINRVVIGGEASLREAGNS